MVSKPLHLTSPKQQKGSYYEQLALAYLQQQGLLLVTQNWQQPKVGELDLVMIEQGNVWDVLVFVEVRQRKVNNYGDAKASVTPAKQHKLIKAACYFLQKYSQYADFECRFDIVVYNQVNNCDICEPDWIQGAFIASAW